MTAKAPHSTTHLTQKLSLWQSRAKTVGIIATALTLGMWVFRPAMFYPTYLTAFIFCLHLSLGGLAIQMLHHITGGRWGLVIRRILESVSLVFPWLAVAFLPLLLGMNQLFPWTIAEKVAEDPILQHKAVYLNIPFFLLRAAFYFGAWAFLAGRLRKLSLEQDALKNDEEAQANRRQLQQLSGPGLILFGLTVTFASVDWIMSLEPHWFSTSFGLWLMAGAGVGLFSLAIVLLGGMIKHRPFLMSVKADHLHDLGKFLMAFVMLWAYLAFAQYLIIWSGNLPEFSPWYLHRSAHGWQWVAVLLIGLHFVTPLLLLLSRQLKRHRKQLMLVSAGLLVMRYLDLYWHVMPNFDLPSVVHLVAIVPLLAVGSWWFYFMIGHLNAADFLPQKMKTPS